ncbi:small integral membrane protein 14 [Brevipalpus obovatus]|uniref:small integral membrane protein 14 n=1 Tax=Brevipalpus obovatus TaxID=246614 RepID=UPI003D9F2E03
MADGNPGSNFCECLEALSQQFGMQSLLARLRGSQEYCTDSYCLDMLDREDDIVTPCDSGSQAWSMMLGWAFLLLILYIAKSSISNNRYATLKKNRDNQNDQGPDHQEVL